MEALYPYLQEIKRDEEKRQTAINTKSCKQTAKVGTLTILVRKSKNQNKVIIQEIPYLINIIPYFFPDDNILEIRKRLTKNVIV